MQKTMLAVALAALVLAPLDHAAAETKKPADLRLEINGGANWGDPHLSINGAEGDLDVGTGWSVGAQAWLDRVGFDYLSLGVQYLYLRQGTFSESGTISGPGFSGTGSIEVKPSLHTFFVNAALRYPEGTINPYVGGGVGFAVSRASVSASGTATVNGQTVTGSGSDSDSSTNFAGQVFGGLDVAVTENVYLGVSARYILTDAKLFGIDVDSRIVSAMATIGYKF